MLEGKRVKDNTGIVHVGLIIIDIDNQADGKDAEGNKIQKQELTWEQAQELDICKNIFLLLTTLLQLQNLGLVQVSFWPRKPIINGDFISGLLEQYQKIFLGLTSAPRKFRTFSRFEISRRNTNNYR